MIYVQIFWSFFQIGLLSFGGGYASLPLIEEQVVNLRHWLSYQEFTDLITISQMTPGPIAINASTFVGLRLAGIPGAIVATCSNVLPCVLIVLGLAHIYKKYKNLDFMQRILMGLRPAVIALIAAAGLSIFTSAVWPDPDKLWNIEYLDWMSLAIFAVSVFLYRRYKKVNPIWFMLGIGLLGGCLYFYIL